jgi:SAM-dependent methyltransferase
MDAEFDRYAARYEELLRDPIRDAFASGARFFQERKWSLLREWFDRLEFDTGRERWLDIGCGKGELLHLGRRDFAEAVGCDLSTGMLGAASGLEVVRQPAPDHLPFEDDSLGLATAVCVFHHVQTADRPALCADAWRVLRPGGLICVIEHNPFNPATQLIVRRTPVDADARLLTAWATRRLLRRAGFVPLGTRYFLVFPESLFRRLRRIEDALERLPVGGQYAVLARKPAS